jgi:hypothetical protein
MAASSSAGGQGVPPVQSPSRVWSGFVTHRIWAAFVERHRLALETGSDQQVRQIFRARRLLAGWVDGIEADQLGGEIDGTK